MRRWGPLWTVASALVVTAAVVIGLASVLREPAPQRAWTIRLGRPSAPVQAGATIAVVDDSAEVLGLEGRSGARRWVWRPGVELTGALAYAGGTVYAGLRTGVCALGVEDGTPRWCADHGAVSRLAAFSEAVLVLERDRVTALAASTGVVRWTRDTRDVGVPAVTVAADALYLSGERGVAAVDARSGETRWRAAGEYLYRPHVFDGSVYVVRRDPGTDQLESRSAADGAVRYASALGGRAVAGPTRSRSLVIVAGERGASDWIEAFGTRTGKRRWRKTLDGTPGPPVATDDLVALEYGGRLRLRDASRGEEWGGREERLRAGERPVRAGGVLVFRTGRDVRAVRL